jgi:hypothetical protein
VRKGEHARLPRMGNEALVNCRVGIAGERDALWCRILINAVDHELDHLGGSPCGRCEVSLSLALSCVGAFPPGRQGRWQ